MQGHGAGVSTSEGLLLLQHVEEGKPENKRACSEERTVRPGCRTPGRWAALCSRGSCPGTPYLWMNPASRCCQRLVEEAVLGQGICLACTGPWFHPSSSKKQRTKRKQQQSESSKYSNIWIWENTIVPLLSPWEKTSSVIILAKSYR